MRFIELNQTHRGIVLATQWLDDMLQRGQAGDDSVIAMKDWRRLAQHEVTAERVLVEISAIWLYALRNQLELPIVDEPPGRLTLTLAHAVTKLAPLDNGAERRVVSYGTVEALGTHLRTALYPLLNNIADSIHARDLTRPECVRALKQPFPTEPE